MADNALEVKDLSVSFLVRKKWVQAIDDVEFALHKGETLGIVGESGCGKSVTSLSILHLLPQGTSRIDHGSIVFHNKDISGYDNKKMSAIRGKQIAMIFQDSMTSLNPMMTIGAQLEEAYRIHKKCRLEEARQYALDILIKVGMPSPEKRMKEYPHQLSGGMRQRVIIAMALIQKPEILIADEPTTALDVTIQSQILSLIKKLKEESGISVMLITHDMGVVAQMCDRIMVMYAGNIMEVASTAEIFDHPQHPYTKGLLASIPRVDKDVNRLFSIEGNVPSLQHLPAGCRFCTRCKDADETCKAEKPPLVQVGFHLVRCWHVQGEAHHAE
ncbi:MAG: ABC transporter ATP-binding protein [Spirochaetaceae bacterium]|nr:ABC transporter ATP-binding protein [Spirochaetaceae bacterium]